MWEIDPSTPPWFVPGTSMGDRGAGALRGVLRGGPRRGAPGEVLGGARHQGVPHQHRERRSGTSTFAPPIFSTWSRFPRSGSGARAWSSLVRAGWQWEGVLGHGRDRPGRVPSQLEPGPGGWGIAWSRRRYRSISDALTTLKTE